MLMLIVKASAENDLSQTTSNRQLPNITDLSLMTIQEPTTPKEPSHGILSGFYIISKKSALVQNNHFWRRGFGKGKTRVGRNKEE